MAFKLILCGCNLIRDLKQSFECPLHDIEKKPRISQVLHLDGSAETLFIIGMHPIRSNELNETCVGYITFRGSWHWLCPCEHRPDCWRCIKVGMMVEQYPDVENYVSSLLAQ